MGIGEQGFLTQLLGYREELSAEVGCRRGVLREEGRQSKQTRGLPQTLKVLGVFRQPCPEHCTHGSVERQAEEGKQMSQRKTSDSREDVHGPQQQRHHVWFVPSSQLTCEDKEGADSALRINRNVRNLAHTQQTSSVEVSNNSLVERLSRLTLLTLTRWVLQPVNKRKGGLNMSFMSQCVHPGKAADIGTGCSTFYFYSPFSFVFASII